MALWNKKHKCLFALRNCYCVECSSYRNDSIKQFIKTIDLLKHVGEPETLLFCINEFSGVTFCALAR